MKLEKWALIAEIVSGLAVVLTLVILIHGIRENTATVRATAAATSRDSLASFNDLGLMLSSENFSLLARTMDPTLAMDELTGAEQFWLSLFQRAFIQRAEAQYFRYRNGLLDDDAWQTVRHRVWRNINISDAYRETWLSDKADVYTPDFVAEIESYMPP